MPDSNSSSRRLSSRWLRGLLGLSALGCALVAASAIHLVVEIDRKGEERREWRNTTLASLSLRLDGITSRFREAASIATSPAVERTAVDSGGVDSGAETRDSILDVLDRFARIESGFVKCAFAEWQTYALRELDLLSGHGPNPENVESLARAIRLDLVTTMAYRDPMARAYPAAISELQAELRGNAEDPRMRLRALRALRLFLGPQERLRSDVVMVVAGGNRTAHGEVLIPEDTIPGILEAGQHDPAARADLLSILEGVAFPAVRTEAIDALVDPRSFVRRAAAVTLAAFPRDEERDSAIRKALETERHPRVRAALEGALDR